MHKLKFAVVVWFFVYPLALLVGMFHEAFLSGLSFHLRTLTTTLILVPSIVFVVVPVVQRILQRLSPVKSAS